MTTTTTPTRLSFSVGNHSYYLRDEGTGRKQRLTSVTTLLGLLAKPALIDWAARTAADYACDHWDDLGHEPISKRRDAIRLAHKQSRDKAAAKGTAIHSLAEQMVRGEPVEVPEDLLPKVQGLARWWQANPTLTVVAAEAQVWSEADDELGLCGFAGTFDLLVSCPRRGLGLLDLKTGSGVYGEYGVQIAGYGSADWRVVGGTDKPMDRITWAGVLHVRTDGTDLHTLTPEDLESAAQRFELLRMLKATTEPTFQMEA